MPKRIRTTESTQRRLRTTESTQPRLDPAEVARALGAEPQGTQLDAALDPISLLAVREELVQRLQSTGGRPALSGVTRRAKIPVKDEDWLQLEQLAEAVASPGFAPSAGQVASVLLTKSLHALVEQLSHESPSNETARLKEELAALVAGAPSE
jgi:hypothetical protein